MRILVTGASGLLGLNFSLQAAANHTILGAFNSRAIKADEFESYQVDLHAKKAVPKLLDETQPDWILNAAAEADIDRCTKYPGLAQNLNVEVPAIFAAEAKKRGIRLMHISTDAVFDGKEGGYDEDDQPNPQSVYARTKLEGERAVLNSNPDAIVARVNFFGWSLSGERSLAEFFYNELSAGKSVNGFKDVFFCPLHVSNLTEVLLQMLELELSGIYHVLGSECVSKYNFGVRLAREFGFEEDRVTPISIVDSDLLAKRSPKLTLNTDKLSQALGHSLPNVQVGIDRLYDQYKNGFREKIQNLKVKA